MIFNISLAEEYAAAAPVEEINPLASLLVSLIPTIIFVAIIVTFVVIVRHTRKTNKQDVMSSTIQASPEELKKLAKLKQDGALSDEEFEEAKKKILNS